jgi:diacylglycerol kinase (ATP)
MYNIIKNLWLKLGYSISGIRDTWQTETSFRQWFLMMIFSDIAAFFYAPSIFWVAIIIAFGLLILAAELINTAIEAIVDMLQPEFHPLAKKAKDAGSAMTLITFCALIILWLGMLNA